MFLSILEIFVVCSEVMRLERQLQANYQHVIHWGGRAFIHRLTGIAGGNSAGGGAAAAQPLTRTGSEGTRGQAGQNWQNWRSGTGYEVWRRGAF